MRKEEATELLLIEGREVRVTHPDKLYFSRQTKLSKLDIVRYYLSVAPGALAGIQDRPFLQDVSIKFTLSPELEGASFLKVAVTRDGVAYVLTDRGVARVFDRRLSMDRSFRPLAGRRPRGP